MEPISQPKMAEESGVESSVSGANLEDTVSEVEMQALVRLVTSASTELTSQDLSVQRLTTPTLVPVASTALRVLLLLRGVMMASTLMSMELGKKENVRPAQLGSIVIGRLTSLNLVLSATTVPPALKSPLLVLDTGTIRSAFKSIETTVSLVERATTAMRRDLATFSFRRISTSVLTASTAQ